MLRRSIFEYINKDDHWSALAKNPNDDALFLVKQNLNKLDIFGWNHLKYNKNPNVIYILKENLNKFNQYDWNHLATNSHNEAICVKRKYK